MLCNGFLLLWNIRVLWYKVIRSLAMCGHLSWNLATSCVYVLPNYRNLFDFNRICITEDWFAYVLKHHLSCYRKHQFVHQVIYWSKYFIGSKSTSIHCTCKISTLCKIWLSLDFNWGRFNMMQRLTRVRCTEEYNNGQIYVQYNYSEDYEVSKVSNCLQTMIWDV